MRRTTRRSAALALPTLTTLPSELLTLILLSLTPTEYEQRWHRHIFAFAATCNAALQAAEEALKLKLQEMFDLSPELIAGGPPKGHATWFSALNTAFSNVNSWRWSKMMDDMRCVCRGEPHDEFELAINIKVEVRRCTARTRRMTGGGINKEYWFVVSGPDESTVGQVTRAFALHQGVSRTQCQFTLGDIEVDDATRWVDALLFAPHECIMSQPEDPPSVFDRTVGIVEHPHSIMVCRATDVRVAAKLQA